MNLQEEYFNSFDFNSFKVLFNSLEENGYVIDGKNEGDISFSSVQIEHMSQNMFDKLCEKFSLASNIQVSVAGDFYPTEGAYYIVYNQDMFTYNEAKYKMDQYIQETMKQYQELFITVKNNTTSIIEKIEHNLSKYWTRNLENEKSLEKDSGMHQYCFSLNHTFQNNCNLWMIERNNELVVTNIVPTEKSELSIDEYNRLLNYFVLSNIKQTDVLYTLTKSTLSIDDILDTTAAQKFKTFSKTSNKSTGHSHPSDEKKWLNFLYSMILTNKYVTAEELISFLRKEGWDENSAFDLALDMEYGITCMQFTLKDASHDM